LIEATESLR